MRLRWLLIWHAAAWVCPLHGPELITGPWCSLCGVEAALAAGYMPA